MLVKDLIDKMKFFDGMIEVVDMNDNYICESLLIVKDREVEDFVVMGMRDKANEPVAYMIVKVR
jgi:hypothetical protein